MAEKKQQKNFDDLLLESIDEALTSLGESVKTAVYFYLENSFHLEKDEIPARIDEFSDALERIFSIGARNLELLFMGNLHARIKLICEWPIWSRWVISDVTFPEYVRLMKQKFEERTAGEMEMAVIVETNEEQEQYT